MRSHRVSAPSRAAASTTDAESAIRPSEDWAIDQTTSVVAGETASARPVSGTCRTRTPRSAWTMNGNMIEVKSPSGTTTSAPSGSADATSETSTEVWAPVATQEAVTRAALVPVYGLS